MSRRARYTGATYVHASAVANPDDAAYNAWLKECERVTFAKVSKERVESALEKRAVQDAARVAKQRLRWEAAKLRKAAI